MKQDESERGREISWCVVFLKKKGQQTTKHNKEINKIKIDM